MKSSLSKIFKFIVVAGLIGAVAFLGIKFLFPAPKADLAYKTTISLQEDKDFEKLMNSNSKATIAIQALINKNYEIDPAYKQKLEAIQNGYNTFLIMQSFMTTDLAFATNNSHYNTYAKKLTSTYKEFEKKVDSAISYIDNNLSVFLTTPLQLNQIVATSYVKALYELNVDVFKSITELNHNIVEIYSNLKTTLINNEFTRALLKTENTWLEVLSKKLNKKNEVNAPAALESSVAARAIAIKHLNATSARNYYGSNSTEKAMLSNLLKADVQGLLNVFGTGQETSFIETIENQEIKSATTAFYDMIKGDE